MNFSFNIGAVLLTCVFVLIAMAVHHTIRERRGERAALKFIFIGWALFGSLNIFTHAYFAAIVSMLLAMDSFGDFKSIDAYDEGRRLGQIQGQAAGYRKAVSDMQAARERLARRRRPPVN